MARVKHTTPKVKPFNPDSVLAPPPKRRGRAKKGEEDSYRASWRNKLEEIIRAKTQDELKRMREKEHQLSQRKLIAKEKYKLQDIRETNIPKNTGGSTGSIDNLTDENDDDDEDDEEDSHEGGKGKRFDCDAEDDEEVVETRNQFVQGRQIVGQDDLLSESSSIYADCVEPDDFEGQRCFDQSQHVIEFQHEESVRIAEASDDDDDDASDEEEQDATSKINDEFEPTEPDTLLVRFGTSRYVEDALNNIAHYNAKETFRLLEGAKNRLDEKHEAARQQFLKLLGQHRAKWHATCRVTDLHVDITKVYQDNKDEYIAFMRIRPNGYRGERQVPEHMEINFHLLIGRATLVNKKRSKIMVRGSHATIHPKSTFSIKCVGHDQTAIFVFKICIKKSRRNEPSRSQALEAVPVPSLNRSQSKAIRPL